MENENITTTKTNTTLFSEFLSKPTKGCIKNFWSAIQNISTSPHYINRKILCAKCIYSRRIDNNEIVLQELLADLLKFEGDNEFLVQLSNKLRNMEEEFVNDIFESLSDGDSSYFIICNENTLKNNSKGCYDIFLIGTY